MGDVTGLLRKVEKFSPKLYNDAAGTRGNCTIGYGHLVHSGPCRFSSTNAAERPYLKGIERRDAENLFEKDLSVSISKMTALSLNDESALTQGEYDAILSLVYNVGVPKNLLDYWNTYGFQQSSNHQNLSEFDRLVKNSYSYGNRKFLMGLYQRRIGETMLKNGVCPERFNPQRIGPNMKKIFSILFLNFFLNPRLNAEITVIPSLPSELVGEWKITDVLITPASFTMPIGGSTPQQYELVKKAILGKNVRFDGKSITAADESKCYTTNSEVEWVVRDREHSDVTIADDMARTHRNGKSFPYSGDHAVAFAKCLGHEAPSFEEATKLKSYSPRCLHSKTQPSSHISRDLFWGGFIVLDNETIVMDNEDWYVCLRKM